MSKHNQTLLDNTGILQLEGASVVIVYTEWNDFVTNELVAGSERTLDAYKVPRRCVAAPAYVALKWIKT